MLKVSQSYCRIVFKNARSLRTDERMNPVETYTDYLKKQITDIILETTDEKLLSTIYAILMEHVIQETQPTHS